MDESRTQLYSKLVGENISAVQRDIVITSPRNYYESITAVKIPWLIESTNRVQTRQEICFSSQC